MSPNKALSKAEIALANGEYRECLVELEDLLESDSLLSENGANIGILMITALIGQGENQRAISICETLSSHKNDSIRQQAKQLISILCSPELERPEEWSVKIPDLNINNESTSIQKKKSKIIEGTIKQPPTGLTRDLKPGFTIVSLIIFLILTVLLSGCVKFTTEIDLTGANHIEMSWDIKSNSNRLLSWQEDFESSIKQLYPGMIIETNKFGEQKIKPYSLKAKDAKTLLKDTIAIAASIADLDIPSSNINLNEKNWLIGIDQNLNIDIDLRDLPKVPGLKIGILIKNSKTKNLPKSNPIQPTHVNDSAYVYWELQPGTENNLSLTRWHWSRLGIGIILILSIMSLSMILQNLKLRMGFGFPELPP